MAEGEYKTPRGFQGYLEMTDLYDARIRVQQSSLAIDSAVWIFCDSSPHMENPSPHLNAEMAKKVIAALQEFVDDVEAGRF